MVIHIFLSHYSIHFETFIGSLLPALYQLLGFQREQIHMLHVLKELTP